MGDTKYRQRFALMNPCYLAEETSKSEYGDRVAPHLFRVLTVNSGFE